MKIAWNEITYQPKKFVLIEFLIATLMFMVVFLSGLTNGLAAALAPFLPSTVPSIMTLADNVTVAISFVVTSILCGALSLLKIKKVDPIEVIGGNGE